MVQSQGVDVYIAPYSDITRRYNEYSIPAASPSFTGSPNEVYIEAVDGERFSVVVDLTDDYDVKGGDRLIIKTRFDETVEAWRHSYGPLSEDVPTGSGLKGRCIIEQTDRQVNGSLVKCGYAFAPLKMDENLYMNPEQVAQSVASHGIVVVELWRCKFVKKKCAHKLVYAHREGDDAPDTQALPKAFVEDNHVSHAVQHTIIGPPSAEKKPRRSRIFRIADPIIFTIRYRSRGEIFCVKAWLYLRTLLTDASDTLRQLKITPRDEAYIDPPPRVQPKQDTAKLKRKRSVKAVKDIRVQDGIVPIKRRNYLNRSSKSAKQDSSNKTQRQTLRAPAAAKSVPAAARPLEAAERNSTIVIKSRVHCANSVAAAAASVVATPFPISGLITPGLPSIVNDRNKKRKALEDELEDIEFEQRFVQSEKRFLQLEQRKRRAQRKLARLEEDVE